MSTPGPRGTVRVRRPENSYQLGGILRGIALNGNPSDHHAIAHKLNGYHGSRSCSSQLQLLSIGRVNAHNETPGT